MLKRSLGEEIELAGGLRRFHHPPMLQGFRRQSGRHSPKFRPLLTMCLTTVRALWPRMEPLFQRLPDRAASLAVVGRAGAVSGTRWIPGSTWDARDEDGRPLQFETFDAAYVDRLRSRDAPTQQHFIAYFSELILLKLRARVQRPDLIEDLKQETFSRTLALLRGEGNLRNPERLGSLVNSICNNVLLEQYRSLKRVEVLEDEAAEQLVESRPDALSTVISDDDRVLVRQVLGDLNERDRSVLRAVFLEERDKDEVCRDLGVDRDYLRVLLHRAKTSFRQLYSKRLAPRKSFPNFAFLLFM